MEWPVNVTILICTYGEEAWSELAWSRAYPSAVEQGALEVLVWHEHDGSLSSSRNEAAASARGDWLCFLDADDELAPGYLDAMRAKMRFWNLARPGDLRVNPLLLVPAVQYVQDGSSRAPSPPLIPAWERSLLDLNCAVIGTLIPRYLFRELSGFRELLSLEDWDVFLRAVKSGARMVPVRDGIYRAFTGTAGRNTDQSPYEQLRREHGPGFDWAGTSRYKVER